MRKSRCRSSNVQTVKKSSDNVNKIEAPVVSESPRLSPSSRVNEGNRSSNKVDNQNITTGLSDSILFDLSAVFANSDNESCLLTTPSSNVTTSTPINDTKTPTKRRRRSSKSPYNLRSPSRDEDKETQNSTLKNEVDTEKDEIDKTLSYTKNIRKRILNNSSNKTNQSAKILNQENQEKACAAGSFKEKNFTDVLSVSELLPNDISNDFYGLPASAKTIFEETRNISKLFDWQIECLQLKSLSNRQNLIYSLPTSGGKTLVAEILILKEIIVRQKDALFIFPFVSIVQEKLKGFVPFANEFNFALDEYAGSKGCIPAKNRRKNTLYLATIEKAHILINSLIESNSLDRIGMVVVDELHMLGESGSGGNSSSGRGVCLEVMLCKIMHVNKSSQIIGMSATLSNIDEIAQFLNAEVYTSNFRPVSLKQMVKYADSIFEIEKGAQSFEQMFVFQRNVCFGYTKEQLFKDPDHVVGLCSEVIPQNSCLVFCSSKKNCENVASMICSFMPHALKDVNKQGRELLLNELLNDADGNLCNVLQKCIPYGVAYHHSGLTMDERRAIESAYLQGVLCLLCCTSTLAAGVNLPAKRVIIRAPYVGRDFISSTQYKQMIGRAGRTGLASEGESILIISNPGDRNKIEHLVQSRSEVCKSSLLNPFDVEFNGLKQVVLSVVGLNMCRSLGEIKEFLNSTLGMRQSKSDFSQIDLTKLLQGVIDSGLMKLVQRQNGETGDQLEPELLITDIGTACYRSSLPLETVSTVYTELQTASKHLVADSFIHLLYLCIPSDLLVNLRIDWNHFLNLFSKLPSSIVSCASVFGISEMLLVSKATGGGKVDQYKTESSLPRFYCCLIVNDLVEPTHLWEVAKKYQCPRGFVQALLSGCSSNCFHLTQFCKNLSEFWALTELLQVLQKKLNFNCSQELHPLLEIPRVKYGRAKQLFKSGYKTLASVANADAYTLMESLDQISYVGAKQIIQGAKMVLDEKIDSLNDEVAELKSVPVII